MKTCPRCYCETLEDEQALNCLSKLKVGDSPPNIYICQSCVDEEADIVAAAFPKESTKSDLL